MELIKEYKFFVPSYQRAYSWTEKQADLFLKDISEHAENKTQYYLGHYILEKDANGKMAIVDGQQRLTTVAMFLAVCKLIKKPSTPLPSLCLDVVEYDNDRFQELLNTSNLDVLNPKEGQQEKTASLERVVKVMQRILQSFENKQSKSAALSADKTDDYLEVIHKAAVSVGVYESKAVAAQIFELHNTRGVQLTETEKVKALLMRYVYLNSTDGNTDVGQIQKSFAQVFKLEEAAARASFRGEMSLDDILMHHLRAIDGGKESQNDKQSFSEPKSVEGEKGSLAYVRRRLDGLDAESGVQYAKALANEFAKSLGLIANEFVDQDKNEPLIGDVILLDQRWSMIFLLRYFRLIRTGEIPCRILLKRWESFLFLWDSHDFFYNMHSQKKNSFPELFEALKQGDRQVATLLREYYSGEKPFAYRKFENGLGKICLDFMEKYKDHFLHRAYGWRHWHSRYKYWLYKYEIENSSDQAGARTSLRGLFKDNDVTLDHIVPNELGWTDLSEKGEQNNNIEEWKCQKDKEQAKANWDEIFNTIDGIGNLLLLSSSHNSSLKNCSPCMRAAEYKKWGLGSKSYREVAEWKSRREWNNDGDAWKDKIEKRGSCLMKWLEAYFTDKATWTDDGIINVRPGAGS